MSSTSANDGRARLKAPEGPEENEGPGRPAVQGRQDLPPGSPTGRSSRASSRRARPSPRPRSASRRATCGRISSRAATEILGSPSRAPVAGAGARDRDIAVPHRLRPGTGHGAVLSGGRLASATVTSGTARGGRPRRRGSFVTPDVRQRDGGARRDRCAAPSAPVRNERPRPRVSRGDYGSSARSDRPFSQPHVSGPSPVGFRGSASRTTKSRGTFGPFDRRSRANALRDRFVDRRPCVRGTTNARTRSPHFRDRARRRPRPRRCRDAARARLRPRPDTR